MSISKHFRAFTSNKQGNIIIWQTPNFLLWLWIGLKLLSLVVHDGTFKTHLGPLSKAVLFAWAYLEITEGDSLFRRTLGAVVITLTVVSFFS